MSSIEQQMTDMAKTELLKEKRMILPMKSGSEVDLAPGIERRDDAVRKRPTVERTLSIRGADNVGEVALQVVPGEPLDYYWEGHGLRLHIPANALDTNIPSLTMRIQASLSGQFRLPDDMELVSGVYWISFPAKSLVQPVTLELQHCARLESAEQTSLTFVTSKCNQETLPYQFEPLPGGVFTTSSDYGAVQVNHFSGVAVSRKKRRRTQSHSRKREGDTDGKTAEQSVAKKYLALTYYKRARSARPTWEMHFTVIPNLDLRMKTLEKYYPKEEVESSLRKTVAFEEEKVTLDIPEGGKYLPSGWSIVPMAYPASLTQSEVDNYEDSIPPSCQLELHLQITKQPYERLVHQIKVIGIQGISSITVTRDIDPDPELSAGAVVLGKRTHKLKGESSISTKLKSDDKPNMKDLMDALYHTVAANWEHIGIYLHFPMATLKVIATKHNSDPHKCLVEMLGVWLERVHPPATWSAIIETVEFLGEEQCGRKLREKYQL